MRKVFAPVVPVCSLCAVTIGIMIVAVPVAKIAVDALFMALGY